MSRRSFRSWPLLLAFAFVISAGGATSATRGAPSVAAHRRFQFTYVVRVPATRGSALRLWVPVPRDDAYQTISGLRIESPVTYRLVHFAQGNEDAYFVFQGAELRKPAEIRIRFQVFRREHTTQFLVGDPPATGNPRPSLAFYLRPDRMIPLNGIIAQLSAQATAGVADPAAKARKIYEYVIAHMRYDKSGTGWGRGDAVWACSSPRGNCTDFHSLFIGMARAAGIPARFRIGFPLPEETHGGEIPGYHCWAEFYLDGVGWVPIDAAEAWLDPARHNFYFGNLDPDRVMFTTGRDLRLGPSQQGQPLNYFVYPYAELDGKVFSGIRQQFFFQDIPR
jgi:transglutaminase-like putative cysteine protease